VSPDPRLCASRCAGHVPADRRKMSLRAKRGNLRVRGFRLLRPFAPLNDIHAPGAPGFTIAEAVISTVIIALMFVAALNTVGASKLTQRQAALNSQGRLFAELLLSEILEQSYKDPGGAPLFGAEPGESVMTRADFDDVDDYNGWTASPPTAKDGTVLANSAGWRQAVTIQWIDPLDPSQVRVSESNAKRITVMLSYNNMPQMTLVAIRTASQ
jgi:type II secretory pathway pseudopilin PulG